MRVLLVEDDPALGAALKKTLQSAGYVVDWATDGEEAQALGAIEPYDLAILDLGLPKRNGLSVLQNWRGASVRLPVIILTARDSWQERVSGLKAGADDYLGKPFQVEELLARMDAVIKRSLGQPQAQLQLGALRLDESGQAVILADGSSHALTAMEYKLLRYLMLHPNHIISKQTLTEHLYAYDEDKDSNVIEVYINRLRQHIGAEHIETRRGQGYRFKVSD